MNWSRGRRGSLVAFGLGIALFLVGGVGIFGPRDELAAPGAGVANAGIGTSAAGLDATVTKLQAQLERVPNDHVSWASLGLAYVQRARITVNPDYYAKAEGALTKSLDLNTEDNFVAASGMAALAAARHDFSGARDWAEKGLAINPSNSTLYGALDDALTQLGDYDGARVATQKMLDLSPDTASLSRASYSWELRGDIDQARHYMQRARTAAGTPADVAFTERYLGDLEFNSGDPTSALKHYAAGLLAFPDDVFCLEGRARAQAALGQADAAVADYAAVVQRAPEPSFVLAYGEYLESLGRTDEAREQYDLFEVEVKLFEAGGVNPDVDQTLYFADHGDPAAALRAGEAGIASRGFFEMQDAYGWALHVNGRDAEAKQAVDKALAIGARSALLHFHAGMIDRALGSVEGARNHLSTALEINPHFSPRLAPVARQTLTELGA